MTTSAARVSHCLYVSTYLMTKYFIYLVIYILIYTLIHKDVLMRTYIEFDYQSQYKKIIYLISKIVIQFNLNWNLRYIIYLFLNAL